MRIIATREATVSEIEPDEIITREGKRYVVDEVSRGRDKYTLACNSEVNPAVTRRKVFEFQGDEHVTVEAGEQDRREILNTLQLLICGDASEFPTNTDHLEYDAKAGRLEFTIGTRKGTRIWSVVFEA